MRHATLESPATPGRNTINAITYGDATGEVDPRTVIQQGRPALTEMDGDDLLDPNLRESPSTLEVVLAYEDLASGLRGKAAIQRLTAQLDREADLHLSVWRFDLIGDSVAEESAQATGK